MTRTHRFTALALAATLGIGIVTAPVAAIASEEGKRNTTIALGALAAGLLLTQKNKLPGLIAAGGAAYAYSQYDASIRDRHHREREYDSYWDNGNRFRQRNHDDQYDNRYRDHNNDRYRDQDQNRYRDHDADRNRRDHDDNRNHSGFYRRDRH